MADIVDTAEANIHLRARAVDRDLIDQAASLTGANRSQFMLASAIEKAKSVLLDQTTLLANAAEFQAILDMLDAPATDAQLVGMQRLRKAGQKGR